MARGGASEVFVPGKRSCPEGSRHCLPPRTLSARSRACFDAAETEEGRNPRKLTRDQCRAPSDRPQIFKARKPQPQSGSHPRARLRQRLGARSMRQTERGRELVQLSRRAPAELLHTAIPPRSGRSRGRRLRAGALRLPHTAVFSRPALLNRREAR